MFRAMIRRHLKIRAPFLLAALAILVAMAAIRASSTSGGDGPEDALRRSLATQGLHVVEDSVLWLAPDPGPLRFRPAMLLAAEDESRPDLYYLEARLSSDAVLELSWVSKLTDTASASESRPVRVGNHVVYATEVEEGINGITLLDLNGEPEALTEGWGRRARVQNAITNLQTQGRTVGFGRRRYELVEPAESGDVAVEDGDLVVTLAMPGEDSVPRTLRIDPSRSEPLEGAQLVEFREERKGRPGTISWVVDSVRNLSFVGPEPITWLEHRYYGLQDSFERAFYGVVGTDQEDLEDDIATEMGGEPNVRRRVELNVEEAEVGLPPPNLAPVLTGDPLRGEGEWVPVVSDPFVRENPGAPPAFYRTFIRADPERDYTRIFLILWDPRQVQLRVMSGTREPESASGQTGRGMAPRDPAVLERFVGGFNGGFQALHGEFGLMSEGDVYLPPKPWAATVGVMRDGRVAMGSWPGPPEGERYFQESWANAQIPDGMVEFRQNLTSVVEDGVYNPWERWYWGAAPSHSAEQTLIHRSALCITQQHFVIYFWGARMSPEALGRAMNEAGCVRAVHLDINHPHTGFEFYNIQPESEPFPPLTAELDESHQFEGPVPDMRGYHMRARKGISSMRTMNFPRYVGADPRDFFYLLLRPLLPGPALTDGTTFSTDDLPHAGWPYAMSRASRGDGEARSHWIRIDPARAIPGPLVDGSLPPAGEPLVYLSAPEGASVPVEGALALYATPGQGGVGRQFQVGPVPREGAARVVVAGDAVGPRTEAALGVDAQGFLVYVERSDGDDDPIASRLAEAGVARAIALPDGVRLVFAAGDTLVDVSGYAQEDAGGRWLPFLANTRPATEVLFPDTEPGPYQMWSRLQDSRVRYRQDPNRTRRFGSP